MSPAVVRVRNDPCRKVERSAGEKRGVAACAKRGKGKRGQYGPSAARERPRLGQGARTCGEAASPKPSVSVRCSSCAGEARSEGAPRGNAAGGALSPPTPATAAITSASARIRPRRREKRKERRSLDSRPQREDGKVGGCLTWQVSWRAGAWAGVWGGSAVRLYPLDAHYSLSHPTHPYPPPPLTTRPSPPRSPPV